MQNDHSGQVLIVDDEINIRQGLRAVLAKRGYHVRDAGSVEEALTLLSSYDIEVAVVDIRLPGESGIELLQSIGDRWPNIAVIMLTGHGTLESAMVAVKAGAHDYLLKPAQPDAIRQTVADALLVSRRRREQGLLLESLRAGLQRLGELPSSQPPPVDRGGGGGQITAGALHINLKSHEVRHNGRSLPLTPTEFKLLVVLASRGGEVVDYVSLVELSLDYVAESWEAKELIKRHIFALRHKIEPDPKSPSYIINVRGVGYRFASRQELATQPDVSA
jgi:DNA-binding response OmpR family regulator